MSSWGPKTRAVWLAVRDNGRALTIREITALLPLGLDATDERGQSRIGPTLHVLCEAGWLARVGSYRFVNARLGRSMGAATTRRRKP